jgi:hypothetical protein
MKVRPQTVLWLDLDTANIFMELDCIRGCPLWIVNKSLIYDGATLFIDLKVNSRTLNLIYQLNISPHVILLDDVCCFWLQYFKNTIIINTYY